MTDARRAGIAVLLVVLAGGAALAALPNVGVVRVAGVPLRWWLGGLVAPSLAALVTTFLMPRRDRWVRGLAAWTGPALVAAIVSHVAAGDPAAATIVLLACVVPLLVLLAAPWAPAPPDGALARSLGVAALVLVLVADLAALGELAHALGGDRRIAVLAGAALATATLGIPRRLPLRPLVLALGGAALVLPLVAVGVVAGIAPWTAWAGLADRPAIVFDARSQWVTEGRGLAEPTTLVFDEPHRVVAVGAGTWRVTEHEGESATVRDWRLTGGEALELRSGDVLTLGPGARVRLEAGKRVPGAPPSGATWAERRGGGGLEGLAIFAGVLVTLTGGVWLLLATSGERSRAATLAAPGLVTATIVAAAAWGVYAAFAGADLALGAAPIAALARVPSLLVTAPWTPVLAACAVSGFAALFLAAADALCERLAALTGGNVARGRVACVAAVAVAAALTQAPADAWRWLTLGCGLAAAAGGAPALAAGDPRARAVGAVIGALAFAALAAGLGGIDAWVPAITAWPALAAAPLAWGATRAVGR